MSVGGGEECTLVNRKVAVAIWCCVFIITKIRLSPFEMATCNRHTHWRRTGVAQWLNEIPNKSMIDGQRILKAALPLFNTYFRTFHAKRDKQWSLKLSVPGCALYSSVQPTSSFCPLPRTLQPDSSDEVQVEQGTNECPGGADVEIHAKITPEFIVKAS